jgi:hypothetical protein
MAGLLLLASCGGGGASTNVNTTTTGSNVATLAVNLGLTGSYENGVFTSVEVCAPGSTSNCVTVPDVLVDTGSTGLRVLSAALGDVSLPSVTVGGNDLQECVQFVDLSYIWGPVAQADIHIAGETASAASVNVISAAPSYAVPENCLTAGASGSYPDNTVANLGANGILGVANLPQDCGSQCISAANGVPYYFTCPNGDCAIASVPLSSQLWNPVALFSQDNNGVLFSLPKVPALGAASATGSLIFGIGTQSNNALGSAQIYATDSAAYFTTTYNGVKYPFSYIDSGSNALYFLDSKTLGGIDCGGNNAGYYCPGTTLSFTVTNTGTNGVSGPVSFSIANADSLFNTGNGAFSNLGGDSGTDLASDYFAFGVPFFFGRSVFVGIGGTTVPTGATAPYGYWAY